MVKQIEGEEFRKLQLIQLGMIKELDRVCRLHGIKYSIFCGTLLGAVRHGGYIPWDDDADIAMMREEYEKFKKVANELDPNICWFQDHDTDSGYRWGYAKLRRTGTTFVRDGQEHLTCKTGVFIDVFPLDDVPKSLFGQIVQDIKCFFYRKTLWSEVAKKNTKGIKKWIYNRLSKTKVDKVYKKLEKYTSKSCSDLEKGGGVRVLLFPAVEGYVKVPLKERYGMPKEWFLDLAEYDFEGLKLLGTRDYDAYLKHMYGDYMQLPPENSRQPHAPVSEYDFGDIEV